MYMFGGHYSSKAQFYSHNKCLPLRTYLVVFCCFFSTFDIKVQFFCFLLKQFFENVKTSLRRGGGGGLGGSVRLQ